MLKKRNGLAVLFCVVLVTVAVVLAGCAVGEAGKAKIPSKKEIGKNIVEKKLPTIPNNPPVLAPIGNKNAVVGKGLGFYIYATDKDNDKLTLTMDIFLKGANLTESKSSFYEGSALFTWKPSETQIGIHPVTFKVTDAKGGEDTETIKITVTAATK